MQIPDGDGALALHVMPRYMLHNNLQAGVQYKQQARTLFGHLFVCLILHLKSHAPLTLLRASSHSRCVRSVEHQIMCSLCAHCSAL